MSKVKIKGIWLFKEVLFNTELSEKEKIILYLLEFQIICLINLKQ